MGQFVLFLILMTLGYLFGHYAEKKHYKSINKREKELLKLPAISCKNPIGNESISHVTLSYGNVVISVDYFKRILASLYNFFGGNIRSYETLLDRARREAILRLKESVTDADQIINLRIETSSIYKGKGNSIGSVEVLAYGTAVYFEKRNQNR
ncbi:MAG: heavy metal-binding domain-containing protein [Methylococcales bacterium]|nr:heavy metal-binding domain-containing protein [Methylococcales bacterium]